MELTKTNNSRPCPSCSRRIIRLRLEQSARGRNRYGNGLLSLWRDQRADRPPAPVITSPTGPKTRSSGRRERLALTTVVTSDRFFVANYAEANITHVVTTATSPTAWRLVAGAGTYTNGQSRLASARRSQCTNPPNLYNFRTIPVERRSGGQQCQLQQNLLDARPDQPALLRRV